MPDQNQIKNLISKAATGQATAEELNELAETLRLDSTGEATHAVEEYLKSSTHTTFTTQISDWKNFTHQIINADKQAPVRSISSRRFGWLRYAAAVIIVIGIAAYLWNTQNSNHPARAEQELLAEARNIRPGTDRAILTLTDGSIITLDSVSNGQIAQQSGSNIIKKQDQIIYESGSGTANGSAVGFNTMATPRGGQYKLVLPDGTKVWLNAQSSISYPTLFVKDKREVKIKGEVYFEVAKNAKKPFIVDVDGKMQVQVLGTHFNINSYENEASIKTTLLEGSVRIIRAGPTAGVADRSAITLKPGEQGQFSNAQPIRLLRQVDLDQTMAWKNGVFNFNGLDIQGVLRQIERWYDVDVKYESSPAAVIFKGEMYRNVNLSDVLEKLQEMSGVNFRMEDKKLIVL